MSWVKTKTLDEPTFAAWPSTSYWRRVAIANPDTQDYENDREDHGSDEDLIPDIDWDSELVSASDDESDEEVSDEVQNGRKTND